MRAARGGIALLVVVAGCVRHGGVDPHMSPQATVVTSDYPSVLGAAHRAALAGRYTEADSALAAYVRAHPSSIEARDAAFWRALFNVDPLNKSGSDQRASEQLEAYLADSTVADHRAEALVLRRLVVELQGATAALDARARATGTPREADLTRENAALKEQLAKTVAELERIRKRLGTP